MGQKQWQKRISKTFLGRLKEYDGGDVIIETAEGERKFVVHIQHIAH